MDGHQLIYFPIYNYTEFNYDNVHEMLTHPNALPGLSDGGAHVGTICDASFPTYLLSYWCRDRKKDKIDLARAVQMLTADGADYLGLKDRGRLRVGLRAGLITRSFALARRKWCMISPLEANACCNPYQAIARRWWLANR